MDKSDNWIILKHFVAGLRSNMDFSSRLLNEVGSCANAIRNRRTEVLSKRKKYLHDHRKLENTMERRKLYRKRRNKFMGKDDK